MIKKYWMPSSGFVLSDPKSDVLPGIRFGRRLKWRSIAAWMGNLAGTEGQKKSHPCGWRGLMEKNQKR